MYLGILVDEHQCIGHVVIAKVDYAASDPAVHLSLSMVQYLLRRVVGVWFKLPGNDEIVGVMRCNCAATNMKGGRQLTCQARGAYRQAV